MADGHVYEIARTVAPNFKAHHLSGPITGVPSEDAKKGACRRQCGCVRTSEKLKHILGAFPAPPPPSPNHGGYPCFQGADSRSWQVVGELVQLVQLSVTATALALYYLIYCYMQLVYYTLRSALYFHHADGPMKITIGVVTVTSLVVGFNLLLRMERILGIIY